MPTSVRLDPKTDAALRRLAAATGRTKSDILREAVARLVAEEPLSSTTVWEQIADLVGVEKGGDPTLSSRVSEAVASRLRGRKERE